MGSIARVFYPFPPVAREFKRHRNGEEGYTFEGVEETRREVDPAGVHQRDDCDTNELASEKVDVLPQRLERRILDASLTRLSVQRDQFDELGISEVLTQVFILRSSDPHTKS